MTQTRIAHQLIDGPSTDRLADAYKLAYNKPDSLSVEFTTDDGHKIRVRITGLLHEDGSGHSHIFYGYLIGETIASVKSSMHRNYHVKGWFYTKSPRHGRIVISSEPFES